MKMRRLIVIAAASLCLCGLPSAQIAVANPGLPDFERISYTERIGDETGILEQKLTLATENGTFYYAYESRSRDSDSFLKLDQSKLLAYYSDTLLRTPDSVIRRTSEVVRSTKTLKKDELLITDFSSILLTLRTFPWGKAKYAKLVFLGTGPGGSGFDFELKVIGKETLSLSGQAWDCWKAELGLSGLLGGLFGKSTFWFSESPPHYLIRSEGVQGPPGSPKRVLEIREYSIAP